MKRVLITGVSSCSGLHAVRHLATNADVEIHGTVRSALEIPGLHECHDCDFRNVDDIHRVVAAVRPNQILHLAGSSDPSDPNALLQTNVSGTWNLLEASRKLENKPDVLLVGSAACFGEMHADEWSLDANRVCAPNSLYGVSRQTQTELGRIMDGRDGIRVFLCRTFNLIGPGVSPRYVPKTLLERIGAAVETGMDDLELRDMTAVRDFIDVRDAVAAYFAILKHGRTGHPYSVGRGEPVTIEQLARLLAREQHASLRFIAPVKPDGESRSGIRRSVADSADLQKDTGWSPQFTLSQSVRDMLAENSNSLASQKSEL